MQSAASLLRVRLRGAALDLLVPVRQRAAFTTHRVPCGQRLAIPPRLCAAVMLLLRGLLRLRLRLWSLLGLLRGRRLMRGILSRGGATLLRFRAPRRVVPRVRGDREVVTGGFHVVGRVLRQR